MLHNVLVFAAITFLSFLCSLIFYKESYRGFPGWWESEGDGWFVLAWFVLMIIAMEKGYFHSV